MKKNMRFILCSLICANLISGNLNVFANEVNQVNQVSEVNAEIEETEISEEEENAEIEETEISEEENTETDENLTFLDENGQVVEEEEEEEEPEELEELEEEYGILNSKTIELIKSKEDENYIEPIINYENVQVADYYSLYIDNQLIELQNSIMSYDYTTFLPMRELGELLGAEVDWIQEFNVAILKILLEDDMLLRTLEVPIGMNQANVISNYGGIYGEVNKYCSDSNSNIASMIINGSTYLPLRFIGENMGYTVTYFSDGLEIHLTSEKEVPPEKSNTQIEREIEEERIREEERLKEEERLRQLAIYEAKKDDLNIAINSIMAYPNFSFSSAQVSELETLINSYGEGVSIYFEDINSGYVYMKDAHRKYTIASVIKAPYAMYIYDLVSQGKADLNATYTYKSSHYAGSSGVIRHNGVGTTYTLAQLLEYSIIHSDNVAIRMLRDIFGTSNFKTYFTNLGLHYPDYIANLTGGNVAAIDAGVYIKSIYNFIQTNQYGSVLREHMLNTTYSDLILADYPVVRKYGSWSPSYHDVAIVEAPMPYLLCIITSKNGNDTLFHTISRKIEEFTKLENRNPYSKFSNKNIDLDEFLEYTGIDIDEYLSKLDSNLEETLVDLEIKVDSYLSK